MSEHIDPALAASLSNVPTPVAEAVPIAPVVNEQPAPAQPTKPAAIIDAATVQTAENTLYAAQLEPRDQSKGTFDKDDPLSINIRGFVGLNKTSYDRVGNEIDMWQEWLGATAAQNLTDREKEKQGFTDSQILAAVAKWEEYCSEVYPNMTMEDASNRMRRIYSFVNNIADAMLVQYPIISEPGLTNVNQRTTGTATGDVNGLIPDKSRDKYSLSEFMRRTSMASAKEPYMYDILCRNSYVAFRYVKPTRLELGVLIKDIAAAVRGHVREVSQNVPALANAAVQRVVWKFISSRIRTCSVKETNDFGDLADVIRITDVNAIGASLLALAYPQGVNFNLSCLAHDGCDWVADKVIDATWLVVDRKHLDTPEEAAAYANMMNFSRKYSREESFKFIKETNYQREIEPVWNANRSACFVLGVPSLTESFEAEEFFSELIEKELARIREESMTEQQYFTARDEFLDGLVGTDYLHYVAEYHVLPPEGSDGKRTIIRRSESSPQEFNQGIVNIIQDNFEMGTELVSSIIKHYPFMSKTFVGMANYQCEKCKGESASYADLGYTPINVLSTFFTLASLTFTGRSKVGESVRQEALLALSQ